jgi:hypothetical protein
MMSSLLRPTVCCGRITAVAGAARAAFGESCRHSGHAQTDELRAPQPQLGPPLASCSHSDVAWHRVVQ